MPISNNVVEKKEGRKVGRKEREEDKEEGRRKCTGISKYSL